MTGVILTARERHGYTQTCLKALLPTLRPGTPLVFVAAGAPPSVLRHLRSLSRRRKGFTLLEAPRLLPSNDARLMALPRLPRRADVAFLENDVVVQKGWLKALEACAREEDSDIVSPVILEGDPSRGPLKVHVTGIRFKGQGPRMGLHHELNHSPDLPSPEAPRERFDAVEFHCLLIRRRFLDACPLAPGLDSMYSHLDLCFSARDRGAKVMVEPASRVVFADPRMAPLGDASELETFMKLWNFRRWAKQEADFIGKWGLSPGGPISRGHGYWSALYKFRTFHATVPLSSLDLALWKVAGRSYIPQPFKQWLEDRTLRKVRRGLAGRGKGRQGVRP